MFKRLVSFVFCTCVAAWLPKQIIRHHQGDIFGFAENCDADICQYNGSRRAANVPSEQCHCQCDSSYPTFRDDSQECVTSITECRLVQFVSLEGEETIPYVFMPRINQLVHPRAQIVLNNGSSSNGKPPSSAPICVATYAEYLTMEGWMILDNTTSSEVPFKLFRFEQRTFLQYEDDRPKTLFESSFDNKTLISSLQKSKSLPKSHGPNISCYEAHACSIPEVITGKAKDFDSACFCFEALKNPAPEVQEFLSKMQTAIAASRNAIKSKKFHPILTAIVEENSVDAQLPESFFKESAETYDSTRKTGDTEASIGKLSDECNKDALISDCYEKPLKRNKFENDQKYFSLLKKDQSEADDKFNVKDNLTLTEDKENEQTILIENCECLPEATSDFSSVGDIPKEQGMKTKLNFYDSSLHNGLTCEDDSSRNACNTHSSDEACSVSVLKTEMQTLLRNSDEIFLGKPEYNFRICRNTTTSSCHFAPLNPSNVSKLYIESDDENYNTMTIHVPGNQHCFCVNENAEGKHQSM